MRIKSILLIALFLSFTNLNAVQTTCQKQNWSDPTTIEDVKLDGGACASNYSVKDMIGNGWRVVDIKVQSANEGLSYTYIFSDEEVVQSKLLNLNENISNTTLETNYIKIYNVWDNQARINIPNLKIGQSGIVEHIYPNNSTIIVANGYVIESNRDYSTLALEKFDGLKHDAIPTTSRKAQDGDIFILNYLYHSSLLVAPNSQSFSIVNERFKNFRFLHSDIFATYLKLEQEPLPTKEIFQEFANKQDLGTIFFVVGKKVHIVDAKTFKVLYSYDVLYQTENSQLPFYTRVSEIEKAFWDIDFSKYWGFFKTIIGANEQSEDEFLINGNTAGGHTQRTKELSYEAYYENLLGLRDVR